MALSAVVVRRTPEAPAAVVGPVHAFARLRLPDGSAVDVSHGDILGRVRTAQVVLEDPRVSEAHALVSLRRGELVLLSLRRMLSVRGRPLSEVSLVEGLTVDLAEGVSVVVDAVQHPARVLAVEAVGLGRQTLPSVASVTPGSAPTLVARFDPQAPLHLWWDGAQFRARAMGGPVRAVGDGDALDVAGLALRFLLVDAPSSASTAGAHGRPSSLRIVAWYDTVEVHREGHESLTLGGVSARILSELAAIDGPAPWQVIAREVWSDAGDPDELRHRWDVGLTRLRARLKEARVRPDLVRSTGSGFVQLVRYPDDRCEDRR